MSDESDGVIPHDEIPQWEFDVMIDLAERWQIRPTEAENQLVAWGILD